MNICNYLYNISSLGLFVGMGHYKTEISPERIGPYFTLWIIVGSLSYYIGFGRHGPFYFDSLGFWPTGFGTIGYNRQTKEMKLKFDYEHL
jgi:hypothetical protein